MSAESMILMIVDKLASNHRSKVEADSPSRVQSFGRAASHCQSPAVTPSAKILSRDMQKLPLLCKV
jgi:hypothetical protein